jgi:hypothetical protein
MSAGARRTATFVLCLVASLSSWGATALAGPAASENVSSAAALQLTDSLEPTVGSNAQAGRETVGVVDASWADDPAKDYFALRGDQGPMHRRSYTQAGMIGGLAQESDQPLVAIAMPQHVAIPWLGSYYATPEQATAAMDDVRATASASGYPALACAASAASCQGFTWHWTDARGDKHTGLVGIAVEGNAVIQFAVDGYAADMSTYAGNAATVFAQLAAAASKVLQAALSGMGPSTVPESPVPVLQGAHPSIFPIGSMYIFPAKNGRARIFNNTQMLHLREGGAFAVIYRVQNPLSYTPSATLTITKDGQTAMTEPMNPSQPAPEGKVASVVIRFTDKSLEGTLAATATLTLGPLTATTASSFQLLGPRKAKCKKGKHLVKGKCRSQTLRRAISHGHARLSDT